MAQFFRPKRLVNPGVLTSSRNKSERNRLSVYRDLLIGIETPGKTGCDKFRVIWVGFVILRVIGCTHGVRMSDRRPPDESLPSMTEQLLLDRIDRGGQVDEFAHWTRTILVNWIR